MNLFQRKILTMLLIISGAIVTHEATTNTVDLPTEPEIVDAVDEYDAVSTYISRVQAERNSYLFNADNGVRFIERLYAKQGEPIKIYLDDSIEKEFCVAIEEEVQYLNTLFEIINPQYKFEVVYEKKLGDYFDANLVTVKKQSDVKSFFSTGATLGKTTGIVIPKFEVNLDETGFDINYNHGRNKFNKINLEINEQTTVSEVKKWFLHEFSHVLGLGDNYLVKDEETMETASVTSYAWIDFISENDLKLLISLYGDNTKIENKQKYLDLVENYNYDKLFERYKDFSKIAASSLKEINKNVGSWVQYGLSSRANYFVSYQNNDETSNVYTVYEKLPNGNVKVTKSNGETFEQNMEEITESFFVDTAHKEMPKVISVYNSDINFLINVEDMFKDRGNVSMDDIIANLSSEDFAQNITSLKNLTQEEYNSLLANINGEELAK